MSINRFISLAKFSFDCPTDTLRERKVNLLGRSIKAKMLNGIAHVVNLTDERRRILQCFSSNCRQDYWLS